MLIRKRMHLRKQVGPISPLCRKLRILTNRERLAEAKDFLRCFYRETTNVDETFASRWRSVSRDMRKFGYYEHTGKELQFGARVAWRNHAKCVGRLYWDGLEVGDFRARTSTDAIADQLCRHMIEAFGNGNVRSKISVFAPVRPGVTPAYIESRQLTQFAGYIDSRTGDVIGDRQNVELTRIAASLGYRPPASKSQFDVLPVIFRDGEDRRILVELPREVHRMVEIRHPDFPEFDRLGLRWYAVPYVSGMVLTIGGIDYPCAPFNGFYMGTEIASRDLADKMRYNMVPAVSRAIGDDPESGGSLLWQDRAMTELNRAVLFSFKSAGVTITDHHSATQNFRRFCQREQASGRHVSADWSWIIPPQCSSYSDIYHQKMTDLSRVPNYYWNSVDDGWKLMPYRGESMTQNLSKRIDAGRRWLTRWRRQP